MNLNIDNVSVKDYFENLERLTLEYRDKLKVHELKLKLAEKVIEYYYIAYYQRNNGSPLVTEYATYTPKHIRDLINEIYELSGEYAKTDESRENGYRD